MNPADKPNNNPSDTKGTRSHEHVFTIKMPAGVVWNAITDPKDLANWFPLEAEVDPVLGGKLIYKWSPEIECKCIIRAIDPPRHLQLSWFEHGDAGANGHEATVVDWHLEGKGATTILRLVHSGFGRDRSFDQEYDGTKRGWAFELSSLKHYLERHLGKTRRAFWIRNTAAGHATNPPADIWAKFAAPGGIIMNANLDSLKPGDRYQWQLSTGDAIHGSVIYSIPPLEFAGTVENMNHAIIRLGYELCGGAAAHFWFSGWGIPEGEILAFERRIGAAMTRVFAT